MKRGDLFKWLRKAPRRLAVFKVMTKPKTTSEIREQALNNVVSLSNSGEVLKKLMEEGLVICINPNEKIGRLYGLTKKGAATRRRLCPGEQPYQDIPNKIIKDYAYVIRGKHRRAIIKVMDCKKKPSQIHRDVLRSTEHLPPSSINYVRLSLNSTSDTLRGFRKKGIARCTNPEKRVGRLYELTKKGKKIREQILKE